jgi:hypothetical protein
MNSDIIIYQNPIGAFGIALLVVIAKIGFGEYQLALFHHKSISIRP